jgi:hypothetical protein
MKNFIFSLIWFFLCAPLAFAEETNSTTFNCAGTWILSNESGWVVRNEKGIILPLSHDTIVVGCAKKPIKLNRELSGRPVEIACQASTPDFALPNVTKVIIICK